MTGKPMLLLAGFAGSVASIAFSLASGFILDYSRNAVLLGKLARFDLGCCCSSGFGLALGSFYLKALLFLELQTVSLCPPFFSRCRDSLTLGLLSCLTRFGRIHCSAIGIKKGRLGFRGGCAAIGKFTVSSVFQIYILVKLSSYMKIKLSRFSV
jgi:hypothetical protein